jgi:cytochrome c oxidase subunit IV
MDAHAHAHAHAADEGHAHPSPALYLKVAVVLFILTALEVLLFEAGRGGLGESIRPIFEPIVVVVLLVLSAAKFILVAMFYMHLKQDPKLLSNLFVFPLLLAATVIASLIVLMSYWRVVGAK